MTQLVFLSGLVLGIQANSEERSAGSLILTTSMPHTRFQILLGKIVGRSVTVFTIIAVPLVGILVAGSVWYSPPGALTTLAFLLVTTFYVVVCVGIGVGVSAVIRHSSLSSLIGGGAFLMALFWELIISRLIYATLTGVDLAIDAQYGGKLPEAFLLFQRIAPHVQYNVVTNKIIGAPNAASYARLSTSAAQPNNSVIGVYVVEQAFDSVPIYLLPEASLLSLIAWFVGALALGHFRFRREVIQ
jgi:ABC-2 type transport system permease protein